MRGFKGGQKNRTLRSERAADSTPPPTYRRNRTMTDRSTIPEVSERARIHHLRAVRKRIGFLLLGVMLIVALVSIGVAQFSGSVRVVSQGSSDISKEIDEQIYRDLYNQYFSKHPFERFRFLTDIKQLTVYLQTEAPEVMAIKSSSMDSIGVSRYDLAMRKPVASWTVDERRFYVDADGVTFSKNYYGEPKVSVVDNSGAQVTRGAAIASSRLLSFVGRVVALSADKNITVTSIEIPTDSMRQLNVKGEGVPMVKMTIDKSVEEQVEDMAAAVKYFKQRKESPRYVDVRALGRVYYK